MPLGHLIRLIYLFYTHVYKLVFILFMFRRELSPFQIVECRRQLTLYCQEPVGGNGEVLSFEYVSGPEEESPQRTCGLMCMLEYMHHVLKKPVCPFVLRSSASECDPYLAFCLPLNPRLS